LRRPIIVSSEKVSLAPLSQEDLDKLWFWVNDKEISQYLTIYRKMYSREAEREWLNKTLIDTENPTFAIINNADKNVIGVISLVVDKDNNSGVLGIFIGEKSLWSQGFGTDAVILLLDYAFNVLNLHKVWLGVLSFNKRAYRTYKKVGFKEVGRFREHIRIGDCKYTDYIVMDILNQEFMQRHESKFSSIAKDRLS
jgi:RimJ/RimL family protein N-acetyltransferase